ncbi:hypothetical protein SAMN05421770_106243 [Granulicella rosea]|uniref:Uncharacterized protein n=1 Tax=Granulicella rosea TaxID=474952 RepID=A0A239LAS0_9BACT|nr:hypothetical protein [Granulicella rosea]SNT27385.1 hypothetical protein SAMN05421770_106243 [Granulicella rosea]
MDVPAFTQLFPKLYHLTFASNLPGIRQHGLLSTTALAKLHGFDEDELRATVTERRRCIQQLHGVTLRDQIPMNEKKMKTCLVGVSIPEWIALLNTKIFFFLSKEKALEFAGKYADYENVLLETDTAGLLTTHAEDATLCRIHPGAFLSNARPRGRNSFIPIAEYLYKKSRDTPAELTLDTAVPNILDISQITTLG